MEFSALVERALQTSDKQAAINANNTLKAQCEYWPQVVTALNNGNMDHARLFLYLSLCESYYSVLGIEECVKLRTAFMSGCLRTLVDMRTGFVLGKVAQVLSRMFVREYAQEWPRFFTDLYLGNGDEAAMELFLKTCLAITETIAAPYYQRSEEEMRVHTELKDLMRARDMPNLVGLWESLLKGGVSAKIQKLALQCFAAYTPWIDVGLTARQEVLGLIYSMLGNGELRGLAVDCLTEIVGKGMPALEKLKLLQYLNVLSVFDAVLGNCGEDEMFTQKTLCMLNACGDTVAQGLAKEKSDALLGYFFELVARLIKFLDLGGVSVEAKLHLVPFCKHVGDWYRRERPSAEPHKAAGKEMFVTVLKVCAYPAEFEWDAPGAEEELFPELRAGLLQAYDGLLNGLTTDLNAVLFDFLSNAQDERQWELALALLHRHPETMKAHPVISYSVSGEVRLSKVGEVMGGMFERLHQRTPSPTLLGDAVRRGYLEVAVRYAQIGYFKSFPHFVPLVMSLFYSALTGKNSVLRSGLGGMLIKVVKAVREVLPGDVPRSLLLVIGEMSRRGEIDTWELCEAFGLACGVQGALNEYNELLSLQMMLCKERRTSIGAVKCIGSLSKGLNDSERKLPEDMWIPIISDTLKPLLSVSWLDLDLLSGIIYAVQRLLVTAKRNVLLILPELFERCLSSGSRDLLIELIPILSATTFRLKELAAGFVANAIVPLSQFVIGCAGEALEGGDEVVGLVELKRQYLAFLNATLAAGVSALYETEDGGRMTSVLLSAVQKSLEAPTDPLVIRSGLTLTYKLLPNGDRPLYTSFCTSFALPASLKVILQDVENLEDTTGQSVLNEVAMLHITMSSVMPMAYGSSMGELLVRVMGFERGTAEEVVKEIARYDQRTIKAMLLSIFKSIRK